MKAINKQGHEWTGEKQDDFWIYKDDKDNLYESKEIPVYQIKMNECYFHPEHGITPLSTLK